MKPLILIDGSSYLYRAYHALPPLMTSSGQPTGAIYGVVSMIKKLILRYQPHSMAVIFDTPTKNFRHELYENYKANRATMPDELQTQIKPLHQIIQAMGIPLIAVPGIEADDVIGTLANQANGNNQPVLIATNDKDMAQLVNPHIKLINQDKNKSDIILDTENVFKKFGVYPHQMIDYLTLIGDSSDNIPGVPGVGPKTAAKWLAQYDTLENIIEHHEKIPGKIQGALTRHLPQFELTKTLVTIKQELDLKIDINTLTFNSPDNNLLQHLFTELEFKNWLTETPAHSQSATPLSEILLLLKAEKLFAMHITEPHVYFAFENINQNFMINISEELFKTLKPFLESPDTIKLFFNIKNIYAKLLTHNIMLNPHNSYDILLESYVLDSTHKIPAPENALKILELHTEFYTTLKQDPAARELFHTLEMPLAFTLGDIERRGVLIDKELLIQQSHDLEKRIINLENQAYNQTGKSFNLSSPKQLQEILYTQFKLPVLEKTPSGQPSTAENVLQELALQYDFPKIILEHRTLSKLKTTYTDKLPLEINPGTRRIHTSYQQALTSTGRLSSIQPNLQNIPIKTEEGRKIRQAFIAPKNYKILSADYSQIELRLMAHLSQDKNLLHAFENNLDIHIATAAEIFNIELDKVTPEQRRYTKSINFGLIYGMSAFGLAKQLGLEKNIAQKYIDQYFKKYPGVHEYMENTKIFVREHGYVETLLGRKLYLPDIHAKNIMRQKAAERAAINAPLQGSAADLIKRAMIKLNDLYLILQVHDELIFEVENKPEIIDKTTAHIKHIMENAMPLSVPLSVNINIGNNWDEAH